MPRTVRPFADHACPDDEGNVIPYDAPTTPELLERTGNGDQAAWPVRLTNEVGIWLEPFEARGWHTILGEATPRAPELILPRNRKRGAISIWVATTLGVNCSWRIARNAYEVTRDDSSIIVTPSIAMGTLRFSWADELWIQQRTTGAGAVGVPLIIHTEDWAR